MKRKIKPKNPVFYPLCEAVINDDMASFNELIETGVEIDGTDYNGLTALFYAAEYGRVEMARKLLQKGADIEFRDSYGNTPLWRACMNDIRNGEEMIHLLLSYGADVNAENIRGISPKEVASSSFNFPEEDKLK